MEAEFKAICERLDLTSIGVNYWHRWTGEPYFTIYAHYGTSGCVSGSGSDIAAAIAETEARLKEERI